MMTMRQPSRQQHNSHPLRQLLEPLESRLLLSAAIQVTGNSTIIANHDITPSIADFTDFGPMSTKFNAAIGRVSRTFIIADTGDVDLSLTGVTKNGLPNRVKITGPNAADFVLTLNASSTIPVGMQSSFTITFIPKGAGLRKATITIPSNDPLTPALTFNIQATGIKTATASNNLQVATTTKGTGLGAIIGAGISLNYTAFLLTSKLESTLDPSGVPLDVTLQVSNVIPGLTQGLAGIKAGESRLLVIPKELGYGATVHGNVPANSSLIYFVSAVSVVIPTVVLSGNAIPIAFKDKTPSALDGTFLGATTAGSLTPLTFTYKITNGNAGTVVFPVSPVVVLTTKFPANFSTSDITIDSSSTFATFTVTYTPTIAGTQSAIVHVRTSDPQHPDFTFSVAATSTPFLDLATSVGTINYPAPANIVSGAAVKFKVPLTISNLGNIAVPGATPPIHVNFYLHDTTSNVDTLISSQTTTNLRGTGAGKSKLVMLNLTVPGNILTGSYKLLVKVNENTLPIETTYSNNNALSTQIVNVTQGFFNVDGLLSSSTFPTSLGADLPLAGKLVVLVRNVGNLTLPAGQKFTLQIVAHPDAGLDTFFPASTITLSAWKPGKTQLFTLKANLLLGLPAQHYQLQALLTPVTPLTESSTADNTITLLGLGDVELTIA